VLNVAENSTGVPSLTGTGGEDTVSASATFNYRNDGVADDMGLYKVPANKGKELQMQVVGISCLPNNLVGPIINSFTIDFGSGFYSFCAAADWGYKAAAAVNFDNSSYLYAVRDAAKIWECALFADNVYALVKSSFPGTPSGSEYIQNASSFTLNWTYEAFKKNGEAYVVSRDNKLQCYDIDLPACGMVKLEVIYGECNAPASMTNGLVYTNPMSCCWKAHGINSNNLYMSRDGVGYSFCSAFHAYVALEAGTLNLQNGSVAKLTITSCAPIDWIPWILFIIALIALVVVAVVLSRRK
jgi:hypothetical protein